jgi:hypothetical protein
MQPQATIAESESQAGEFTSSPEFEQATHEAVEFASEAKQRVERVTDSVLDSVADTLEDFAEQLRKQDLASLSGHIQTTAERSPGLFFAGSVATGLALARFMKSSSTANGNHDGRAQAVHTGTQRHTTPPPPPTLSATSPSSSSGPTGPRS